MALTMKQKTFCQNIVAGMTYKDAYKAAYNTKASEQVLYNESSKLMLREDINDYIKTISKPLEQAAQSKALTEREKKRSIIWDRIEQCIQSGDDSAIARYMDILNKMDAEYININRNIDEQQNNITELDTTTLLRLVE